MQEKRDEGGSRARVKKKEEKGRERQMPSNQKEKD